MATYEDYLQLLNTYNLNQNVAAPGTPVPEKAVLPKQDGYYNITYTVFTKADHTSVFSSTYLENTALAAHVASAGSYIAAVENAAKQIMSASSGSNYAMLFGDVAPIKFISTDSTPAENDIGVITFGQLEASYPGFKSELLVSETTALVDVGVKNLDFYGDIWINSQNDLMPLLSFVNVWKVDAPLFHNDDYIVAGTGAYRTLLEEITHALGVDAMKNTPEAGTTNGYLPRVATVATHKYSVTTYTPHPDMFYDGTYWDLYQTKTLGPFPYPRWNS